MPYVFLLNRLVVVQYEDFEGERKTFVWEPLVPDGTAEAPYYSQPLEKYGEFLGNKVFSKRFNSVEQGLSQCGLRPEDVDFASYDHLHVQDPRWLMGTTEPVMGESAPRPELLPNAVFISQRLEVDTFRSPHPMQWAWYVEGGLDKAQARPPRGDRGRRGARRGHRDPAHARPHRRQPVALRQHARAASGCPRRTAWRSTTGSPSCRRSPA